MIRLLTFILPAILMLSACTREGDKTEVCERISFFSRIVMDARQNDVDKDFVTELVLDSEESQSMIDLRLIIVDRAYELPIMETPTEQTAIAVDFANIMHEICLNPKKIDPATIA